MIVLSGLQGVDVMDHLSPGGSQVLPIRLGVLKSLSYGHTPHAAH